MRRSDRDRTDRPARTTRSSTPARPRPAALLPALCVLACVLGLVLGGSPAVARPGPGADGTVTVASAPGTSRGTALPAADQVVPGQVTVEVDALDPEVLTSGEDLTVSGTIANGTDEPVSALSLRVAVQTDTPLSTADLASWMTGARTGSLVSVLTQELDDDVQPGRTRSFSLTVPWDSLPLGSSQQWGPRGVEVSLVSGGYPLAHDRTLLVWDDSTGVQATHVTVVVPVTASPAELALLSSPRTGDGEQAAATTAPSPSGSPGPTVVSSGTPDPLSTAAASASVAPGPATSTSVAAVRERVLGLLGLAGNGVVLAVDPALMEALGVPATQASSPASPDPSSTGGAATTPTSSPAPGPTTPPSPASPDAVPSPSSSTAPSTATELTTVLHAAAVTGDVISLPWADADLAALSHLGREDLITTARTRSAVSGTVSQGASTGVAWVAGPLDTTTLQSLDDATTTVIAAPGDLPIAEDLTYTPSGTTVVDGRTVLVPDTDLSAALGGRLRSGEEESSLSELGARQVLRADTAILTRQAPSLARDVVVALSRAQAATTDPETLAARLRALTSSGWASAQDLDSLLADADESARDGRDAVRSTPPERETAAGEVTRTDLSQAAEVASYLGSVASVLSDPAAVLGRGGDVVATTASASWRSAPAARAASITAAQEAGAAVAGGLTATPSSTINLISSSADLPVRIMSDLDQDVTVRVHLVPSSPRLQADADTTVTVPAGREVSATVPVTAVGSGDVELTIEVLAADGTPVGTSTTVHMRVRADWESLGTRVIGLVLVLMLAVGITRTVRRGRRTVTPQEKP